MFPNSKSCSQTESSRIPELDGLRGFAILMVLFWHYGVCAFNHGYGQFEISNPILKALFNLVSLSWSGVDLFFVLSGFLIGGILLKNAGSKNYFKAFYARRAFRIFPLYYFIVLLFFFCRWVNHGPAAPNFLGKPFPLWAYATYTQNFLMAHSGTLGPQWLAVTWSLAVEEQFYLIMPWVIRVVQKRLLPWGLLFLIFLAPALRMLAHALHWPDLCTWVLLPCRMDSLLTGVLIAHGFQNKTIRDFFYRQKQTLLGVFMLLGALLLFIMLAEKLTGLRFTVLAFFYGSLLILTITRNQSPLARLFRNPLLGRLGLISYGLYLFHEPVNEFMHFIVLNQATKISTTLDLAVTLMSLVMTVVLAAFSYDQIEKRFIQRGHQYCY